MPSSRWVDFKEVKANVSIEQVLNYYGIPYKEARGNKLLLACPLHEGDNPRAFHVDLSKNVFKCFTGCKKGGNVLDLMMALEDLPIRDAALRLQELFMDDAAQDDAPTSSRRSQRTTRRSGGRRRLKGRSARSGGASGARAGDSPTRTPERGTRRAGSTSRRGRDDRGDQYERDEEHEADGAGDFDEKEPVDEDENAQGDDAAHPRGRAIGRGAGLPARPPRRRDRQARGEDVPVNPPLALDLRLRREHPYLERRAVTQEAIREFGLGYCPRGILAGRIAIPIHNPRGELVAYAGRHPKGNAPKYKFPSGFHKSVELYNLHRAKAHAIEHGLVLVEGFFDVIVLWQLGVPNAVALMGTELSAAQEELLVAHTDRVVLLLDGDEAGQSAMEELLPRLARRLFVKVVELPDGVQPDGLGSDSSVLEHWIV